MTESLKNLQSSVDMLSSITEKDRKVDLVSLELITIIGLKMATSEKFEGSELALHLNDLDNIWKELAYPLDFKSVGRIMFTEAFLELSKPERANRILKQVKEPIQLGRYPASKKRLDLLSKRLGATE